MQRRVPGTVARGDTIADAHLVTGKVDGELADRLPFEVTREVLERGRERYGIFCTPCHDAAGTGGGMIVLRGMKRPETFHSERLKAAPVGHYFDVMTRGFGAMYDVADRIPPRDRWAIAAYVRVLQRANDARLADVPPAERARLEQQP
jgi:cytochrome c